MPKFSSRLTQTSTLAAAVAISATLLVPCWGRAAETCTTQARMLPADRATLAEAATRIAAAVQAGDTASLQSSSAPALQADFSSVAALVAATAPELRGAKGQPEQLYLLDASSMTKAAGGANPDAQFECPLQGTADEADFSIPQLPPAVYAFAMVQFATSAPVRLSMLLERVQGQWKLAGLYPRALSAAGHDGLWYWRQARTSASQKQSWNAWLYFGEAQQLLTPAGFVSSTHLDKLAQERAAAIPPALSSGISPATPLVIKGVNGAEYRFTSLSTGVYTPGTLDVVVHYTTDTLGNGAEARHRNDDATAALLAAHPELRTAFHGVWVFADLPSGSPYGTELAMAEAR